MLEIGSADCLAAAKFAKIQTGGMSEYFRKKRQACNRKWGWYKTVGLNYLSIEMWDS